MVECGVKGVAVSIDSVDPGQHDRFRGGAGAWEHSMRAIDICRAHGLEVLVQSTVMAFNYDHIHDLIRLAHEKGAWSFNLYFLVRTGRGNELNDLSPGQTAALLSSLADSQDDFRPMLVRAKCAPQFKQIAYERGRSGLESGGCMAGTRYARITPEGDVTACPYMTVVAGNVREQSFDEIWHNSLVLQQLRDLAALKGRCGRCEFKALCGGCRCRAQAAFGDYLQEDPACTYQPTGHPLQQPELVWTDEARARLDRIPIAFVRDKVRQGLEAYAQRHTIQRITIDVMKEALNGEGRSPAFERLPAFFQKPGKPN
jgi:radical SAM protein with 4Fe4S-binding SPASM domain